MNSELNYTLLGVHTYIQPVFEPSPTRGGPVVHGVTAGVNGQGSIGNLASGSICVQSVFITPNTAEPTDCMALFTRVCRYLHSTLGIWVGFFKSTPGCRNSTTRVTTTDTFSSGLPTVFLFFFFPFFPGISTSLTTTSFFTLDLLDPNLSPFVVPVFARDKPGPLLDPKVLHKANQISSHSWMNSTRMDQPKPRLRPVTQLWGAALAVFY